MQMFKRLMYFFLTNLLVVASIGIVLALISHFFGINFYSGGYTGILLLCSIWGFGGAFVSLLLSKFMAKSFHGVKLVDPQTADPTLRRLVMKVHEFSRRANLPKMPEVGIYESPEPNAFATGPSRSSSLVAVSTGLLRTMNDDELDGVLAHEVAHVANGDMVTLTLIQGVVNSFVMFISFIITNIIMNALRRNDDNRGGGMGDYFLRHMIHNLVSIVFTLLGSIIVMYFSRAREFRADAGGARFASSDKMTAALRRLQMLSSRPAYAEGDDEDKNERFTAFKISNPHRGWARIFMTHPPLEERIAALQNRTYLQP